MKKIFRDYAIGELLEQGLNPATRVYKKADVIEFLKEGIPELVRFLQDQNLSNIYEILEIIDENQIK